MTNIISSIRNSAIVGYLETLLWYGGNIFLGFAILSGLLILFKPLVVFALFLVITFLGYLLRNNVLGVLRRMLVPFYLVVLVAIGCIAGIALKHHRIGIALRYPVAIMKASVHNQSKPCSRVALVRQSIAYVWSYLWSKEYMQQQLNTVWHNHLLDYKITFFSYYDMQHLFYEIFGRQIYSFSADTSTPFIIDCGSNIGITILYFKKLYPQAHIIGFEPGKQAYDVLMKNVQDNHLTDVEVYNKALADHDGTITFFTNKNNLGCTRMNMIGSDFGCMEQERIDCVRLSQYINKPVDFLKIDVEGAEGNILQDLAQSGKIALVKQMAIEYHHHLFDKNEDKLSTFLKILEDHHFGYQFTIDGDDTRAPGQTQYPMIYAYRKV